MNDITWCVSPDCPSKDCAIHIRNHPQIKDERQIVSMADFSGVCRYYIGRVLMEVEERSGE